MVLAAQRVALSIKTRDPSPCYGAPCYKILTLPVADTASRPLRSALGCPLRQQAASHSRRANCESGARVKDAESATSSLYTRDSRHLVFNFPSAHIQTQEELRLPSFALGLFAPVAVSMGSFGFSMVAVPVPLATRTPPQRANDTSAKGGRDDGNCAKRKQPSD